MEQLALHQITQQEIASYKSGSSHATLIIGPSGIGKRTVALFLASQALGIGSVALHKHPYVRIVGPNDRSVITIDAVRELQRFLQLRTTGMQSIRRVVIVENADSLTLEAQNAFLKILEEPPEDTIILLTTAHARTLLPTIRSRVQTLSIRKPGHMQVTDFFKQAGHSEQAVSQAYFLSGGLPGLMDALLAEDAGHPLAANVVKAKELLTQTALERLAGVENLAKQRDTAQGVIDALQRIAQIGVTQAAGKQDSRRLAQWHRVQSQAHYASLALQKNANTKLTLTKMLLHI